MIYIFNFTDVCPSEIKIELDEQNVIQKSAPLMITAEIYMASLCL